MSLALYRVVIKYSDKCLRGSWETFELCQKHLLFWKNIFSQPSLVFMESSEDIEE